MRILLIALLTLSFKSFAQDRTIIFQHIGKCSIEEIWLTHVWCDLESYAKSNLAVEENLYFNSIIGPLRQDKLNKLDSIIYDISQNFKSVIVSEEYTDSKKYPVGSFRFTSYGQRGTLNYTFITLGLDNSTTFLEQLAKKISVIPEISELGELVLDQLLAVRNICPD